MPGPDLLKEDTETHATLRGEANSPSLEGQCTHESGPKKSRTQVLAASLVVKPGQL